MKSSKNELRSIMKIKRKALTPEEMDKASASCLKQWRKMPVVEKTSWVYAYISCRNEMDTTNIILESFRMGKRVAVPKVFGEEMRFYEITSLEELVPGAFGILEPDIKELGAAREVQEKGIVLVPGLAFDQEGGRMGYGGGYYDRYLEKYPQLITIGLAYDFQIIPEVPRESHDKRLDYVIVGA